LTAPAGAARRLTVVSLTAALYFIVSGGPYGLEDLIAATGYERALFLLFLTPILWSLPTSLMVAELSAALPEDGGYYAWVRRALGPFWGFQEAWLSIAASIFDMAIYPTLFALYVGRLVPRLSGGWAPFALGAGMIAVAVAWNLRGAEHVGRSVLGFGLLVLAPFGLLVLLSVMDPTLAPAAPSATAAGSGGLVTGLLVAMWNFMGWDNASTFAGEVHRPQRTYPLAILGALSLIVITYALPVWAARAGGLDPASWSTGSWVDAGNAIGGGVLGLLIAVGGAVSALCTFSSLVLSYSRVPGALAADGLLPAALGRKSPKTGVPVASVLLCGALYAACLGLGFERLVELDVVLYGLSLLLEFAALVALRRREPDLPRPFRVPGGLFGAVAIAVPPMALILLAIWMGLGGAEPSSARGTGLGLFIALLGAPAFAVLWRKRGAPVVLPAVAR